MTDAERRILEFFMTSGATRLADLPDWLLTLLEAEGPGEMSHELITTASLLYARRLHPGIDFQAALALMAAYAADPARLDDLCDRFAAFRLSCCFERLKRAGWFEEVVIDDPFDPAADVAVKLTEARWESLQRAASLPDPSGGRRDFSRN